MLDSLPEAFELLCCKLNRLLCLRSNRNNRKDMAGLSKFGQ